jgi:metallo-beta-lactamase family protein
MPELLFHGAAGEVTGSMHMIRFDGRWVALDCGLFQGRRAESEEKNRQWPAPPNQIAAVVLSHAHTDHTGRLPRLLRDGYEGPIFCTPATRDLCAIMLPDSAHIQEEDVYYVNKRRRRKGLPPIEPLYGHADAVAAVRLMQTVSYDRWFEVVPGLLACFQDAGHMLGSAGVRLEFAKREERTFSLYFSGDVGRPHTPILRDPAGFPPADAIICESTYGARTNESVDDAKEEFRRVVERTVDRGGKVIIPAFSVGRTQTIVYYLHQLFEDGQLRRVPVFVDSPLAVNATEVFKLHPDCYDAEARAFRTRTGDILGNGCCTYIRDVEESKALHRRRSPCVILSASGMCETGRIQHHIKNNIRSRRNTILFPGYQAEGTLGRKLVDGARTINLFHETLPVNAEIVQIHGFSGHADQAELLNMLAPRAADSPRLLLVHGEPAQSRVLAEKLRAAGFANVHTPARGERLEL